MGPTVDAEFCQTIAKAQVDVEKMFETVCQGTCKPSKSPPFLLLLLSCHSRTII